MNSILLHSKSHTILPGRQLANKQKTTPINSFSYPHSWHFSDETLETTVCVYTYDYTIIKLIFKNRGDNILLKRVIGGAVNKLRI